MPVSEHESLSLPMEDASHVGEARRTVVALTQLLGFDETHRGQAALLVTELGNNLVRHARGGELVVRTPGVAGDASPADCDSQSIELELLAIDRGPGMANMAAAMRDGYSTAGTPGTGLGAVRRLSDEFDFCSTQGVGTVMFCRLRAHVPRSPQPASPGRPGAQTCMDIGVLCLPKPGETACGDAWWLATDAGTPGRTVLIVADGLGHGLAAADASRLAVRLFRQNAHYDLVALMELLHAGLRSSRGAAVALLEIQSASDQLQFVGVGNIAGAIVDPASGAPVRNLMSHNGTVGAELRRVQQIPYQLPPGALLVVHSDGLSAQWHLEKHRGLIGRRPAVIAGVLYRDHRRIRDDATVLVMRRTAGDGAPRGS